MADKNSENSTSQSALVRYAGAFLALAVLCAGGALMAYGSTLKVNNPWVIGFIIVGLAALAAWFMGRSRQRTLPRDEWSKQRSMMGVNSVISTVLFLVLLVGVNYVAARRHKTFDLTSNRINSLSEQTQKALQKLSGPVTLTYVYAPTATQRGPAPADAALLDRYKDASDNIAVKYLDAALEPDAISSLNLTGFTGQQPVVVVQGGAKDKNAASNRQQVEAIAEQNITSALMKLGEQKSRFLYYLIGHGEAVIDATGDRNAHSLAKARLEGQGYTLRPLNLLQNKGRIPADASLVAALGPISDLTAEEESALKKYAAGKGRLFIAMLPVERPLPRWRNVLKSLGVQMLDGFVIDQENFYLRPQAPLVTVSDVSKHAMLGGVEQNSSVLFYGAVPLKPLSPPPAGLTVNAAMETSISSQSAPMRSGGTSEAGPFALALAVERGPAMPAPGAPSEMRAVVLSNPQLGSDQWFDFSGTGNFFLSAINWVAGNELLVSIPPKEPVQNKLDMPANVQRFASIFSLVTLPLAILLMGGYVWWKRR